MTDSPVDNQVFHSPRAQAITRLYVIVAAGIMAFGLVHHEMWRDEMEAWLVARDSHGLAQLIENLRYEQQFLWVVLLKLVVPLGYGPHAMQVVQWFFAVANAFLVARFSPFSLTVKGLIIFSYFFLYEYGVISRIYSLGLFLLLCSCALLTRQTRERPWLWLGLLTLLMAHVIVHYWVIAACLMAAVCIEHVFVRTPRETYELRRMWIGVTIAVIGLALPFVLFPAPGDSNLRVFETPWTWNAVRDGLAFVTNAFLPVQTPWLPFWDHHWLPSLVFFENIRRGLALVLIVCFGLSFLRRPSLFVFYCTTTSALLLIFIGFYPGWLRHHGLIVIALIATLWIEPAFAEVRLHPWLRHASATATRVRIVVLPVLLTAQCVGAAIAVCMDVAFPFSPAKAAAQLIRDSGLESAPIVGDPAFLVQTVLGYLPGAREAYYPASGRRGSFPRWDRTKVETPTWSRLIEAARTQSADRVVIVLGYRNAQHRPKTTQIAHLGYLPESMAMGEEYDVYLWQRHADLVCHPTDESRACPDAAGSVTRLAQFPRHVLGSADSSQ